jgi:hypothetical protein
MGENIQILTFVIIVISVIGGVGSIRGASWRPDRVKLRS